MLMSLVEHQLKLISYIILSYLVKINQNDSNKICALLSLFKNLQQNSKDPEQLC